MHTNESAPLHVQHVTTIWGPKEEPPSTFWRLLAENTDGMEYDIETGEIALSPEFKRAVEEAEKQLP